ncbi:MAG: hypothetical protein ACRDV1_01675 [Actinomycetes bacterium]
MTGSGTILAHGVGGREDLPIPFSYAVTGAVLAIIVSFVALGLLWREPRLRGNDAGRAIPDGIARVLDGRGVRVGLRLLGVLATAYVGLAAVAGRDDALNPVPGAVYVLFWIGVPLLSVLLGPVWKLVNPLRSVHWALSRALGTRPEQGLAPLPATVGYWPAAAWLLSFVWLELVAPDNTSLPVLRMFFAIYLAVHLLAATYWGSRWFDRGDGFEVYSSLVGRLSPLGRRSDGRLVLRNPLDGVAGTPEEPGLFAVVGVLLGSTAYDSLSSSPWWITLVQDSPLSSTLTETVGLVAVVAVVTGAFSAAAALSGLGTREPAVALGRHFAHSIVPIVVGYVIAHYWSLLVLIGQQTVIQLSDPLGTGADWLGTGDRAIDARLVDPTLTAYIQVTAVIVGHVLGVVLAHDRAVRVLPRRHVVAGQVPLLVLMVGYTVGGLTLLFAA